MFDIRENLKKLPDKPGVYLYKNKYGEIIYVGKAISLKNRVRQYFQSPGNLTPKTRALVSNIDEFEYIITDSEIEALMLESTLIKKNQPKYNVLLRDDKTFPYIKVTLNEKYPRIIKTRKVYNDGAKYFGPYTDVGAVNQIIDLLNRIYPLKKCSAVKFPKNCKPCLNYHIGQCYGICMGQMTEKDYAELIDEITGYIQGRNTALIDQLTQKMRTESEQMNFEKAAEYRDYINALNALSEKQKIVLAGSNDMDIIVSANGEENAHAMIFFVRQGKLTGRESFPIQAGIEYHSREITSAFIKQYYSDSSYIPKEIIVAEEIAEKEVIEQWLSMKRGSHVKLVIPQKGEKKALLDMAIKNIVEMSQLLDEKLKNQREKTENILKALSVLLGVDKTVNRIEAYDISNTNGVDSVGAMVVFEEGKPNRKDYRRFKIRTIEGPNDYGSLQEVIYRRFKHGTENSESNDAFVKSSFSKKPDLILVDGGEKQAKAVNDVLKAMTLDIPTAGMVKDNKHKTRGLVFDGREIHLKEAPDIFTFISKIQEEVHRFAVDYHRNLRNKSISKSELDEISEIGPKRKMALLRYFGSMENIKKASKEDLCKVEGMNKRAAEKIQKHFENKS